MENCAYHKSRVFIPTERKGGGREERKRKEKKKKYSIDYVKLPRLLQKTKTFSYWERNLYSEETWIIGRERINGLMSGWRDKPKDRKTDKWWKQKK